MKSAIIFLYRYQTLQYTYIDTVSTYIACINYINVVIVKDTHPRLSVTNTIGCNAGKRVILMIFVYKYNLHGY